MEVMDTAAERLQRMCRTCLVQGQNLRSIYENAENITDNTLKIHEMIAMVAPQLKINTNPWPEQVCAVCLNTLHIAYKFQQMCIASEKHLEWLLISDFPSEDSHQPDAEEEFIKIETGDRDLQNLFKEQPVNVFETQPSTLTEKTVPQHDPLLGSEFIKCEEYEVTESIIDEETDQTEFLGVPELECSSSINQIMNVVEIGKPNLPEDYKCAECSRHFKSKTSFSVHIKRHCKAVRGSDYQCNLCIKKFNTKNLLTQHAHTHPENRKHKCKLCDKAFALKNQLTGHMNMHNGLKPFVCEFCQKAFYTKRFLTVHRRTHFKDNKHLCPQCGKAFNTSASLHQHRKRHSEEKPFQCLECPSKFTCASSLTKHRITHSGLRPHVCETCGSTFKSSCALRKHKFKHTGERPHKCKECNMTFVISANLRRHMRTHTGEKPHKCKFCDRAYSESGDLNKHLRTHVGAKTYKCDECTEAFKYLAELREHQGQHFKQQKAVAGLFDGQTLKEQK